MHDRTNNDQVKGDRQQRRLAGKKEASGSKSDHIPVIFGVLFRVAFALRAAEKGHKKSNILYSFVFVPRMERIMLTLHNITL